jgi:hypothetical protein
MSTPNSNGIFDQELNYVLPPNLGTWDDLTEWSSFNQWPMQPDVLTWALDLIDIGVIENFALRIQTDAAGIVSYKIYVSDTGEFDGEETVTEIQQGDEGIPGFTGRYIWIEVTVTPTAGVNVLNSIQYTVVQQVNSFSINDYNTATLPGTVGVRQLTDINSFVTNIQITPKAVESYALDLYVSNTPTSDTVIPRVISKQAPVTIGLVGLDNQPRDAIVDIVVEYLPEGYMDGNDLMLR